MWMFQPGTKKTSSAPGARRSPMTMLVSGGLIAISFVAFIVPLALFHAAQVAAMARLGTAIRLLVLVVATILALGVISGSPLFLVGGMNGLLWLPLFAFAIHQRSRLARFGWSAVALCLPTMLLPAAGFLIPAELPASFLDSVRAGGIPGVIEGPQAEQLKALLTMLQENNPAMLKAWADFLSFGVWQRLAWFVFGDGVHLLFSAMVMGLANLAFLDLAFEQVEKLDAAMSHVLSNRERFQPPLVEALASAGRMRDPAARRAFSVRSVLREQPREGWRSFFLTARRPFHRLELWGLVFELEPVPRAWNLRALRLPIAVIACATVALAGIVLAFGKGSEIVGAASHDVFGPLIGLGGLAAFVAFGVVALQGSMIVVQRTRGMILLLAFFGLLIVGAVVPMSPYAILGALGILAILDYKYDFRGVTGRVAATRGS